MMKKIIILSTIFVVGGFGFFKVINAHKDIKEYDYSTKKVLVSEVREESISQELIFSGVLKPEQETLLSSKIIGYLEDIYVNIGDRVKSGDVLAKVNMDESYVNYNFSKVSVVNSEEVIIKTENLKQQDLENVNLELKLAEKELKISQTNLNDFEINSKTQIINAEKEVEKVDIFLQNIGDSFEQEKYSLEIAKKNTISQSVILLSSINSYIYGSNNKNYQLDDFSLHEGILQINSSLVVEAKKSVNKSSLSYEKLKEFYNNYIDIDNVELDNVKQGLVLSKQSLEDARQALEAIYNVYSTSLPDMNFNEQIIDNYEQTIVSYGEKLQTLLFGIKDGVSVGVEGIESASLKLDTKLENEEKVALKNLEIAKENLSLLKSQIQTKRNSLLLQLDIAKDKYSLAQEKISTIKANYDLLLQQARYSQDQSKSNQNLNATILDNGLLKAPFDGIVTNKMLEKGSLVGLGTGVLLISKTDNLKVVISIPENQSSFFGDNIKANMYFNNDKNIFYPINFLREHPSANNLSHRILMEFVYDNKDFSFKPEMSVNVSLMPENNNKY